MTNVTAKHGQAAVHLGGHEFTNGRWSPACGTQHHNVGGREMTPLHPTDKAVTCKRCLKTMKMDRARTNGQTAPVLMINAETSPKARQFYSPEIKRTEKSGMDSLRDMLKLY